MHLDLVAVVVEDYDPAIEFFVGVLGFDLVEDSPSLSNGGQPKRWVVVRPPHSQTGLLLARADGPSQEARVGRQVAERVGFFLRVDDFKTSYQRMVEAGVEFLDSSLRALRRSRGLSRHRRQSLGPARSGPHFRWLRRARWPFAVG
jgi:catechol 2,3-dioxygenase-like lactoylglutathione lyase family enzyme